MIRKISAHYIFPADASPLKLGIVVINDQGDIIDLIDTRGKLHETSDLEFYNGIITPGFVNAHTHLELSHLKEKIDKQTGLINFIKTIGSLRNFDGSLAAMQKANAEMIQYGTVAAADISNTSDSFQIKSISKIKYFTFIEIFGVQDSIAKEKLKLGIELWEKLKTLHLLGSITPHAPYSMSDSLWHMLMDYSKQQGMVWSVHNQESPGENQLYIDKTGEFADFMHRISDEFPNWQAKGVTSLNHCRHYYKQISKVLLVHNTFTSPGDLESINDLKDKVVFVLCPNANLYIENHLPDIELLRNSGHRIALGTDSLASNMKLSVLEEMKTIQRHFPKISLQELVDWGTINGAKALGFDDCLGSLQKGKKPGLNLITNINFEEMKLTSQSEVKVLC
jgi:cytosine/adenosine deaminase-related metal-dependent hydrolase